MNSYHQPVLLQEALEALAIRPEGTYIDATFGGGGHAKAILDRLTTGRLFAFDQDEAAAQQAKEIKHPCFTFFLANFRFIEQFLITYNIGRVDGIIADLGVSSHQLDTPQRGFAARLSGPLDMRMNQRTTLTAAQILNTYQADSVADIFRQYGEVRQPSLLTNAIMAARKRGPLTTTTDLKEAVAPHIPRRYQNKYYAKLFQSLRIAVNDELGALKELLTRSTCILSPGGRLVVLAYHSLEDRMVKKFMKTGNFAGEVQQDTYGNLLRPFLPLYKKPIMAAEAEIQKNRRARSARLRAAILLDG